MLAWIGAFFVTQVVEVPIWTRAFGGRVALAFAASLLTHPIVWFVLPRLPVPYTVYLVIAEGYAVVVEAIWAWRWGVHRPWLWSLGANAASFTVGMVLRWATGWP